MYEYELMEVNKISTELMTNNKDFYIDYIQPINDRLEKQ